MAETYSIGTVARDAQNVFGPTLQQTTSSKVPIRVGDSAALPGSEQLAMSQGTQILCKLPDGSQAWYTIDAERSIPGNLVMLKV